MPKVDVRVTNSIRNFVIEDVTRNRFDFLVDDLYERVEAQYPGVSYDAVVASMIALCREQPPALTLSFVVHCHYCDETFTTSLGDPRQIMAQEFQCTEEDRPFHPRLEHIEAVFKASSEYRDDYATFVRDFGKKKHQTRLAI